MKLYPVVFLLAIVLRGLYPVVAATPIQISGQFADASAQPLAYVSIGVINAPAGTVADAQGRFVLYITDQIKSTDTVQVSLIGYRSRQFTVAEFMARLATNPQVVLDEDIHQLTEVRIDAKASRVKTIGKTGFKTKMVTNFALSELPRQNLGAEIGRRFNTSSGLNRLDKFQFYVITDYDSVGFRINVYRAKTMKNLLSQNLYANVAGKSRRWVEIDLLPYQIAVSGDVVIAVQWIDSKGTGTTVQMPLQMPAATTHFYRYGSQDRWKKFRGMTTSMNLTFTHSRDYGASNGLIIGNVFSAHNRICFPE